MTKVRSVEADPRDLEQFTADLPEGFKIDTVPMSNMGGHYIKISHPDFENSPLIHPHTLKTVSAVLSAFGPGAEKTARAIAAPQPIVDTPALPPTPAPAANVIPPAAPAAVVAAPVPPAPAAVDPTPALATTPKKRGRPPGKVSAPASTTAPAATVAVTAATTSTPLEDWQQSLEPHFTLDDMVKLTLVDVAVDDKKGTSVLGLAAQHPNSRKSKAYSIVIEGQDFGYVLPVAEEKYLINAPALLEKPTAHKGLLPSAQRLKVLYRYR